MHDCGITCEFVIQASCCSFVLHSNMFELLSRYQPRPRPLLWGQQPFECIRSTRLAFLLIYTDGNLCTLALDLYPSLSSSPARLSVSLSPVQGHQLGSVNRVQLS